MSEMGALALFSFISCLCLCLGRDIEREITVEIRPGTQECFYEAVKAGETLDIEYQVIDGGQGELDIDFTLHNPFGVTLVQDLRRGDSSHRTKMTEAGDYKLCFDNSFSTFNAKTVFFGILVENEDEDDDDDDLWDSGFEDSLSPEDVYEMKVEDIKDGLNRIRGHLTKSRLMQDQLRAYEARDRNTQENNYTRVNFWSTLNIVVMLSTGMIQVVLLRSLFDEKSRLHGLWKKK